MRIASLLFLSATLLFLSGCTSPNRFSLDYKPSKQASENEIRPSVITVMPPLDMRTPASDEITEMFIPGIWRASGTRQSVLGDIPVEKRRDLHYLHIDWVAFQSGDPAGYPYGHGEISPLIAKCLKSAGCAKNIMLGDIPYSNQQILNPVKSFAVPPETADFTVEPVLDKWQRNEYIYSYGLSFLFFLPHALGFPISSEEFVYSLTLRFKDNNSGKILLEEKYDGAVQCPLEGLPFTSWIYGETRRGNFSCQELQPEIQKVIEDFCSKVEKTLPPANNLAYYADLQEKRNTRTEKIYKFENSEENKEKHFSDKNSLAVSGYGKCFALVIGNNRYKNNITPLKTAENDAETVAKILKEEYGYNVILLKNATRADILLALEEIRNKLLANDNLFIYYAGHGWLDKEADEGYWLPVDSSKDNQLNWVSNASITTMLKAIKAKHILVVADSCYSGKLTRGLSVKYKDPSSQNESAFRKARSVISSGGLGPVDDASASNQKNSVFASEFIKALKENQGTVAAAQLFSRIKRPVMLGTDQEPEYADIHKAGHDGGEFLFIKITK